MLSQVFSSRFLPSLLFVGLPGMMLEVLCLAAERWSVLPYIVEREKVNAQDISQGLYRPDQLGGSRVSAAFSECARRLPEALPSGGIRYEQSLLDQALARHRIRGKPAGTSLEGLVARFDLVVQTTEAAKGMGMDLPILPQTLVFQLHHDQTGALRPAGLTRWDLRRCEQCLARLVLDQPSLPTADAVFAQLQLCLPQPGPSVRRIPSPGPADSCRCWLGAGLPDDPLFFDELHPVSSGPLSSDGFSSSPLVPSLLSSPPLSLSERISARAGPGTGTDVDAPARPVSGKETTKGSAAHERG